MIIVRMFIVLLRSSWLISSKHKIENRSYGNSDEYSYETCMRHLSGIDSSTNNNQQIRRTNFGYPIRSNL